MKLKSVALALTMILAAPVATDHLFAQDTDAVETAVFGMRPFMQTPRISPDGTKIAVKLAVDGADYIALVDLNNPAAKPQIIVAAEQVRETGDRNAVSWRWVGNNNVLITLQSRENLFGSRADLTRLVSYNLTTKQMTPLAWEGAGHSAANILYIDHDKATILLQRSSSQFGNTERWGLPEVVKVDVNTGKFTIEQRTNPLVQSWIVDGKGVIRAGIGSDRDSGKQRLMYRSNASGTMQTVSNEADKTFTGANITPEIFLDEPDMAYATSNKDGYRKVYKVNMKTMTLGEPVFAREGYDVGSLISNLDDNQLMGVAVTEEGEREYWIDEDMQTIQGFLEEKYGKGNVQLASRDRKNQSYIFFIGKPNQAGGWYLYNISTGSFRLIGWYNSKLQDKEMNPTYTVRYSARDGSQVPAVVTLPRHRKGSKNLPVVVMPHGGPFGIRDLEEFGYFPWHQAIAEMGYVVIQPNYRGSGGYGKDWVMKGRAADGYGQRMQDDLNDAVAWFAKEGLIDPKRACIMGWSYGGYATARGAQRDPDVWRCAIAGAGVYDFPMMKAYDQEAFGSFGASYQATVENLSDISSARHADGKWSPILIVAGLRDARIPIEQSRTLVSRLKSSGKVEGTDFKYIEQPKGTHNLPYEEVHVQWLEEAGAWLTRFNPAYISSDSDKPPVIGIKRR